MNPHAPPSISEALADGSDPRLVDLEDRSSMGPTHAASIPQPIAMGPRLHPAEIEGRVDSQETPVGTRR
jgi:hypothetical protein